MEQSFRTFARVDGQVGPGGVASTAPFAGADRTSEAWAQAVPGKMRPQRTATAKARKLQES